MTSAPLPPERWRALQDLVDGALDRPPAARGAFLRTACGTDAGLLEMAERLVAACERADSPDSVLSGSALTVAAPMMAEVAAQDALREEQRRATALTALREGLAGSYDVRNVIGRGGMATVYLAHDRRHHRDVAIKVLEQTVDPASAARFLREIRITARLTHPHVLGIHDSGDVGGFLYFVMPLAPGETLRALLQRERALPIGTAVRLLREIADALAYAHEQGIVHRDLKPENVLLSGDHAVVADFGIARALAVASLDDGVSASSALEDPAFPATTAFGTPAYMAPEQLLGAADHRADLYALGIIAHEMLSGALPSGGRTGAGAHVPLRDLRDDVPAWLDVLVARLLERDPQRRPSDARAVLRSIDAGMTTAPDVRRPLRVRAALIAFVLLGGLTAYGWLQTRDRPQAGAPAPQPIAVLPFTGAEGGSDYIAGGIADALAHTLGRLPGLRVAGVTSSRAVHGRADGPREIGRALGVAAIVTGTVRRDGGRLIVSAAVVRTADGVTMWEGAYDGAARDLIVLQDEIAGGVAAALLPADAVGAGAARPAGRGTADAEAYDHYMKGRFLFLERGAANVARSIQHFRDAVARDPGFARAHAALAIAYGVLPSYVPDAADSTRALLAASARRAAALDSTLSDAQVALGIVHENAMQFESAVERYRRAIELEPSNVMPYHTLGMLLHTMGRTDDALFELQRAARLDPLAKSVATARAVAYVAARRFPEAAAESRRALVLDSTFPLALLSLGTAQAFSGAPDSAIITLERARELHPQQPGLSAALLYAYAAAGRWPDAMRLRDSIAASVGAGTGVIDAALADLILGDAEPLIRLLTSPHGQQQWLNATGGFGCNPLLDPLWSDARFRAAMSELNVLPCRSAQPWPFRAADMARRK